MKTSNPSFHFIRSEIVIFWIKIRILKEAREKYHPIQDAKQSQL